MTNEPLKVTCMACKCLCPF